MLKKLEHMEKQDQLNLRWNLRIPLSDCYTLQRSNKFEHDVTLSNTNTTQGVDWRFVFLVIIISQAFRRRLKEEGIEVNINSSIQLLDSPKTYPFLAEYIQTTSRFPHLMTYVDT